MKRILQYIAMGCSMILCVVEPAFAQQTYALQLETATYSFGTISEDDGPVSGQVELINRGNEAITITEVLVSCSCVSAQVTDSLVQPGAKSTLQFSFNPLNYPGHIDKQIFIYTSEVQETNTETLFLTGDVTPTTDPTREFRFAMGPLLVKQKQIKFSDVTQRQIERISCFNNSSQPMTLTAADGSLPRGVTFHTEPRDIPHHTKAELVFSFDPALWQSTGNTSFRIPIEGIATDESIQAAIQIIIQE